MVSLHYNVWTAFSDLFRMDCWVPSTQDVVAMLRPVILDTHLGSGCHGWSLQEGVVSLWATCWGLLILVLALLWPAKKGSSFLRVVPVSTMPGKGFRICYPQIR